jgi:hypothetical protein
MTTDCGGTDESGAMTVMLSQPTTLALHSDRLLPADPAARNIAPGSMPPCGISRSSLRTAT